MIAEIFAPGSNIIAADYKYSGCPCKENISGTLMAILLVNGTILLCIYIYVCVCVV